VLFELQNVTALRAGAPVLEEITVGMPEGTTCVVGPSGSGKSTLLRLLNRLADPDQGAVRYRGRDVRELDVLALRREVGLVPQIPALLDGTVEENVSFGPRLAGRRADVSRLLQLSGLGGGFAARDAGQLSVGEQQRVMLARALALEPRVLLLDEPTSALDATARDAVEATLLDLHGRLRISLVTVTHDRAQADRLAEFLVELEEGRVVHAAATEGSVA